MQASTSAFTEQLDLTGKTACVTGAASGIGRAAAKLLANLGAHVHVADRNADAVARLAAERPNVFRAVVFDQASRASVDELAAQMTDIDILINNAGMLLYEPLLDLTWEKLEPIITIDLSGAIMLTRLVGEHMVLRKRGVIVHTSSQLIYNGAEFRSVYTAAKAGISQFVKTAALEWGKHGVRVNCVAPGRTLTAMNRHLLEDPDDYAEAIKRIPLGRLGRPEDIANAMVFLASDASAYVTGHTLVVDGGWILA